MSCYFTRLQGLNEMKQIEVLDSVLCRPQSASPWTCFTRERNELLSCLKPLLFWVFYYMGPNRFDQDFSLHLLRFFIVLYKAFMLFPKKGLSGPYFQLHILKITEYYGPRVGRRLDYFVVVELYHKATDQRVIKNITVLSEEELTLLLCAQRVFGCQTAERWEQ